MATKRRTPSRTFRWTRAHLARLPDDGQRYEVLNGALLVTPQAGASHQDVASYLIALLRPYCAHHQLGVTVGPGAVVWNDNELQPDVQVIPGVSRLAHGADWTAFARPVLVVEILSPGSDRHDRIEKRAAYMALGIAEYWMVNIAARTVTVCRPAHEDVVIRDTLTWQPNPSVPALTIPLGELFA